MDLGLEELRLELGLGEPGDAGWGELRLEPGREVELRFDLFCGELRFDVG